MVWKSRYSDVAIGGAPVPELVRTVAAQQPHRIALVDGPTGAQVDYRELVRRVDAIAAWLSEEEFQPGDRLALWAPNTPPWAAFALAAMQLGGAVTALNPAAVESEIASQVEDAHVSVLVTIPSLVPTARRLGVRRLVVIGQAEGAVPLADVLATTAAQVRRDVDDSALALLPYSSGTTGLPKGVMLTHANLVTVTRQISVPLQPLPDDVTLALAPWFHILGFTAELLVPLAAGATVVTQPGFDPEVFLDLLQRHRVTYLAVPPPVAAFLARSPAVSHRDLTSLEFLASGGAPLAPALHRALAARLPGCAIGQGWGLSETSGAISVPRRREGSRPGTVATLLPNTELRVVDTRTGQELGTNEDGELWVRGPQTMAGYLGRPEATAEIIDADGWVHTGDLGHVDEHGDIVILDRLKELIKVNAYQVAPAELEALLLTHPAVADVAVVGAPDERTGQAPVAIVVPAQAAAFDAAALMQWLAERVAPYKRLHEVRVVDALPRTPSGKLLRRFLTPEAVPA
jgi:acyl-CoA synthetase (AMP-forming)/AMP-acid ligase II